MIFYFGLLRVCVKNSFLRGWTKKTQIDYSSPTFYFSFLFFIAELAIFYFSQVFSVIWDRLSDWCPCGAGFFYHKIIRNIILIFSLYTGVFVPRPEC